MPEARGCHGVVLAGGGGSRLGQPKPSAELGGKPLVAYPIEAFRAAGLGVSVVAKQALSLSAEVDLILEPQTPLHPLLGIVTALDELQVPIVVCACDMPFVTSEMIRWIAGLTRAPVIVPSVNGRLQPMFGRYEPDALDSLRSSLERETSMADAVETAGLAIVDESEFERFGDTSKLFFDVDTPDDLGRAAAWIS